MTPLDWSARLRDGRALTRAERVQLANLLDVLVDGNNGLRAELRVSVANAQRIEHHYLHRRSSRGIP